MEELSTYVLKGFGVKAKKIVKEKTYYICDTDKGIKLIRKSYDTCDNIFFQHEIKEYLSEAGFHNTDRFHLSEQDTPYFVMDDNTYVMTDQLSYREIDYSNRSEFIQTVDLIARMHKLAREIPFTGKVFYGSPNLVEGYKKRLAELTSIKKIVSAQKRLSDFDVTFIKNYGYYLKLLKNCIQALEKTNQTQQAVEAANHLHVCHNLLKEENLLANGNDIYITKFSCALIDSQLNDLCAIIRRYARISQGEKIPVYELLDIYNKANPLGKDDVKILYPLLKYPYHFLKICSQYYSKKRTWTPSALVNRMDDVLAGRDGYEEYVGQGLE